MSQISAAEFHRLSQLADELREVFVERGHRVGVALDTDPAFGSGTSRASLARDLALATIGESCGPIGLDFRNVNGGRELRLVSDRARHFRLLKAQQRADGRYFIPANSDSALASPTQPTLYERENWVFAWTFTEDVQIGDVFIAPNLGYVDGSPGHWDLGPITLLGTEGAPATGFTPTDEDLDGFDEIEVATDEFLN